ncbi:MAG: FHA domain-containing protein [Chloroflexi bacterium]|nr:FHA domain-containing protein [Chloroflexota bacterium]
MNGKIISGPAAVLIVALFFLPWIAVSCDGAVVGEYSGYNLATGITPDDAEDIFAGNEINGDPILFAIPLAGIVTLILLAITLGKRSFELNASWGQIIVAFIALLVLFLEWLQLRGQGSDIIEISIKPAVWGTIACLLGIGLGSVIDLIWSRKRPFTTFSPPAKETRSFEPTPVPPLAKDDNYTILDEGLIGAESGVAPIDTSATILDEDLVGGVADASATMLDEDLFAGDDEEGYGSYTMLGDEIEDIAAATPGTLSASPAEPEAFPPPPQNRNIEKTEVLHFQPEIEAWLLIDSGGSQKEKFFLQASTTIGRDPSNDLVLDDTALSGTHARIFGESGRFFILDQNSTNGIFIFNTIQNQWEKQDQYELQDGSQIKLGRIVLHFERSG